VSKLEQSTVLKKALLVTVEQAEQIAEQSQRIAELSQRIFELESLVEQLREELGKNSSNSSNPPSSDSPSQREKNRRKRMRRANKRKRGGQPGHEGHRRELVSDDEVDAIKDHYPSVCESCWQPLPEVACGIPTRVQVTELTGKRGVKMTEHRCHRVRCSCGYVTKARMAEIPSSAFGPRLCCTVAMLTGVFHLSRRQTRQLLWDLFGITISLGSISNIEARMSRLLKAGYEQAKSAADKAAIKHTDGTGWRRAGCPLQLWTVATTAVTVFMILADGSARTLRTLFGCIKGILISDRAKAINFWAMKRRQICWAHLLRKFISFSERAGPAGAIGKELVDYCEILFETYHAFVAGEISRRVFRERIAPVRSQVEALLAKAAAANIKRLSGSCQDIITHKEALWTFVDRVNVEPTNNHAERELRAFVLWRKKSFGSQSERGDRFAERIMTAVHSLRKQRRSVLHYLTALWNADSSEEQPALLTV
jgi:transposase